jgi:hypothetical protein
VENCDEFEPSASYFMNSGKSQMWLQNPEEKLLVRYLLGKLNDDEEAQVENRAFADPDYLGALEAAEEDLIDAYVRNELPKSDRGAFERRFLTSPSRRSKVEFAGTFLRVSAELDKGSAAVTPSSRPTFAGLLRSWHPMLQFTAGLAALACLVAGSWLIVENTLLRSRVATLESQRRDAEIRREILKRQLFEERNRTAGIAARPQSPAAQSAPVMASLVLAAGISRAQSKVELLALDRSVQIVHIEIELESRDEFPEFRAGLRTRKETELLTFASLPRRRTASGNVVSFDVPASALASGEYELALQGISPGQPPQDVGYYYFRVEKR